MKKKQKKKRKDMRRVYFRNTYTNIRTYMYKENNVR